MAEEVPLWACVERQEAFMSTKHTGCCFKLVSDGELLREVKAFTNLCHDNGFSG